MKTRNLLLAFALPTLFAACTAEEIVNQADNSAVLANRALLGDLSVKIENPVASRASWSEEDLKWGGFTEEDVFSGAVVDAERGKVANNLLTNYVYSLVNGAWDTNSQMVEGVYSFYSYNGIKDKNDRKPVAFDLTAQTTDLDNPTQVIDDNQLFFSPLYDIEAKNVAEGNVIALPLTFYPYHSIGAMKMINETGQTLMITQIIAQGEFAAKGAILPTKIQAAGLNWNVRKGEAEYKLNYKNASKKTEYTAKEVEDIWMKSDLDNIGSKTGDTEAMSTVLTMDCGSWEWADGEEIMAYMVIPANSKVVKVEINVVDENGDAKLIRVEDKANRIQGYGSTQKKSIASTGIEKQEFKRSKPVSVFGYVSGKPKSITAKDENLADATGYYIDNKIALIDLVNSSRGDIDVYNFGELFIDAEIAEVIAKYTGGVVNFVNPIDVMDEEIEEISNIQFSSVTVKGEDDATGFEGTTVVFKGEGARNLTIEAGATVTIKGGTYNNITNYGALSVEKAVKGSNIANYSALNVYNNTHDITLTQGSLNFLTEDTNENGKVDTAEKYEASLPTVYTYYNAGNYAITYAEGVTLKVVEDAVIAHNDSRRGGTLTLNDNLKLEAELTIDYRCGMTIEGDTETETDGSLVINGSLINEGEAKVAIEVNGSMVNNGDTRNVTNNGHITAGKGSRTDVKATTVTDVWFPGEIDNTAEAKVNHEATAKQIVYYTVRNSDVDELEEIDFNRFNVNTLNVEGTLTMDRAFDTTSQDAAEIKERLEGLDNLMLANDAKVEIDGTVHTYFKNIYLKGNATIEGWSETESYLVLDREDVNVVMINRNVKSTDYPDYDKDGYTLTIKDVDVKCQNGVITFYTRKEYNGDGYDRWLEANVITKDAKFITPLVKGGTVDTDIDLEEAIVNNSVLVKTVAELKTAVEKGENVTLQDDLTLTETVKITKSLNIDLNEKTLSHNGGTVFKIENAKVEINGEGKVESKSDANLIIVAGEKGKLTVNGGHYVGTIANMEKGQIVINDGYFEAYQDGVNYNNDFCCLNRSELSDPDGDIILVKGGTFKKWNPAYHHSEGTVGSYVHVDYKVTVWNVTKNCGDYEYNGKLVSEQPYDGNNWTNVIEYTVVSKE